MVLKLWTDTVIITKTQLKLYPQPMDLLVNSLKLHSLSSPKTFNLGELESQPVGCIVIENLGG